MKVVEHGRFLPTSFILTYGKLLVDSNFFVCNYGTNCEYFETADDVTVLDYLEIELGGLNCSLPITDLWETFKELINYCRTYYIPTKRLGMKQKT